MNAKFLTLGICLESVSSTVNNSHLTKVLYSVLNVLLIQHSWQKTASAPVRRNTAPMELLRVDIHISDENWLHARFQSLLGICQLMIGRNWQSHGGKVHGDPL